MDIDILFYDDQIINDNNLIIPHPGSHLRSTVLLPLNEIAPNFLHPVVKKTITQLIKELKK